MMILYITKLQNWESRVRYCGGKEKTASKSNFGSSVDRPFRTKTEIQARKDILWGQTVVPIP